MFRDFIYLDVDRIQSIIAQLEEEFMGSVTYPDIAVSPIALYREVTPFD